MLNWIRLELKQNSLKPYLLASACICAALLGFYLLFAVIPVIEGREAIHPAAAAELDIVGSYRNIITLVSVLNMGCFAVLSAVMYARFVLREYQGKRLYLMFSYPVRRSKLFAAKCVLVSGFTICGAVAAGLVSFAGFALSEAVFHLVPDTMTGAVAGHLFQTTAVLACLAAAAGLIAMRIGFARRSVSTAIVAAVLLSAVCSQIFSSLVAYPVLIPAVSAALVLAALIVYGSMTKKINQMEA